MDTLRIAKTYKGFKTTTPRLRGGLNWTMTTGAVAIACVPDEDRSIFRMDSTRLFSDATFNSNVFVLDSRGSTNDSGSLK